MFFFTSVLSRFQSKRICEICLYSSHKNNSTARLLSFFFVFNSRYSVRLAVIDFESAKCTRKRKKVFGLYLETACFFYVYYVLKKRISSNGFMRTFLDVPSVRSKTETALKINEIHFLSPLPRPSYGRNEALCPIQFSFDFSLSLSSNLPCAENSNLKLSRKWNFSASKDPQEKKKPP